MSSSSRVASIRRKRARSVILRSFLKGLIILGPIAVTGYVIWLVFSTVDSIIPNLYPGLGAVLILVTVTLIGFAGSRWFLGKAVVDFFDHLLERTPGIKYIYSSVKDVMGSFVGDKKRFNKPVWVCVQQHPDMWRIGFLTQNDMEYLGMAGHVAVYLPHSYAISGWVIVVDAEQVKPITTMSAAEAMKFAVSGGITISEEAIVTPEAPLTPIQAK
jgi:uncharacterized membrane protein